MIIREFPDLQWLKQQANQRFENRKRWDGQSLAHEGWPTVILNTKTHHTYRDNIKGPFSIFSNLSGTSTVYAGKKKMLIHEGYFGISNAEEEYTLAIDNSSKTETLNIHFGEHFATQAFASLTSSDVDCSRPEMIPSFLNRITPLDASAAQLMHRIKNISSADTLLEEELLFSLLQWLWKEESEIKRASTKLSAIKTSTKEEIINRLIQSTDYIYAFYKQDISLDELAQVAYLSKFHYLRLFKTIFRKTPHQFINEVRVQHAKSLLTQSPLSIHEIATRCGFTNPSTFSRMFFSHVGVYPLHFKTKN